MVGSGASTKSSEDDDDEEYSFGAENVPRVVVVSVFQVDAC